MPYDAFLRDGKWNVFKLNGDNQPSGEALSWHDSQQAAKDQIKAMYASEGKEHAPDSLKSVGYIAPRPLSLWERIANKQRPGVTVFKRGNARYMFIVTSNGYRDREREYITTQTLKNYVERSWVADDVCKTDNDLLFWHEDELVGSIGSIFWADMQGPFLLEVAKEGNGEKAKRVWDYIEANPQQQWGASHGFRYETKVLSADGTATYHDIEKFETSVLPLENAANPYTFSGVIMSKERDAVLEKMGIPIAALRGKVADLEKGLAAQGVEHKSADVKGIVDNLGTAIDTFLSKVTDNPAPGMKEDLMAAIISSLAVSADSAETAPTDSAPVEQMDTDQPLSDDQQEKLDEMNSKQIKLLDTLTTSQTTITQALIELQNTVKGLTPLNDLRGEFVKLTDRLSAVEKQLSGRPRAASQAVETVVTKEDVPAQVQKELTKTSSFWGTTLKETQ